MADAADRPIAGTWPVAWLLVAAAMYGCVPETDHLERIGYVLAGVLVAELVRGRPFHWEVQLGIGLLLGWAVVHGAVGRERALVGGWFAFWPVVLGIAWWFLAPARSRRVTVWIPIVVGGAASLVVARTGALEPGWGPALTSVAVWGSVSLAVTALALVVVRRRSGATPVGADQPAVDPR